MKLKFDINIAVLGCQSTGKSTFVNALVGAAVSESSFGRTTEEINVFRLYECLDLSISDAKKKRPFSSKDEELEYTKRLRSVEHTHTKIREHNVKLKNFGSLARREVQTFEVPVAKLPISMRDNTQLCIIESPGLNISNPGHKEIRKYFETNWEIMDAAVLVIDAKVSADHQEQMENVQFVHNLWEKVKKIPVYVLCNKVDDPDFLSGSEEELKLKATREHVEKVFKVRCREQALYSLLESTDRLKYNDALPAFIPVSAKLAFLLSGSAMTQEDFSTKMAVDVYNDIGHSEVGKSWRSMSPHDKAGKIYQLLTDPNTHNEWLRLSGFGKFLLALEKGIGGDRAQLGLIQQKLKAELSRADFGSGDVGPKLTSIDDKLDLLQEPKMALKEKFWASYASWAKTGLEAFESKCRPDDLGFAAQKLIEYQKFCSAKGGEWIGEISKIQDVFAGLVDDMMGCIHNNANNWNFESWSTWYFEMAASASTTEKGWSSLSPVDWLRLLNSILLLRSERAFCHRFGQAIVFLEEHKACFEKYSLCCPECCNIGNCTCGEERIIDSAKVILKEGKVTPFKNAPWEALVWIHVPKDFTLSQDHFAHVGWLFCNAKELAKGRKLSKNHRA